VLSSGPMYRGPTARRVVVKASIVRLGRKGLARATAHMRDLQRDGRTREGERGRESAARSIPSRKIGRTARTSLPGAREIATSSASSSRRRMARNMRT
jgi:hypothetical protein